MCELLTALANSWGSLSSYATLPLQFYEVTVDTFYRSFCIYLKGHELHRNGFLFEFHMKFVGQGIQNERYKYASPPLRYMNMSLAYDATLPKLTSIVLSANALLRLSSYINKTWLYVILVAYWFPSASEKNLWATVILLAKFIVVVRISTACSAIHSGYWRLVSTKIRF